MKRRQDDLLVFLGPSLPQAQARALAPCRILAPARQGDVWRALAFRPRVIALVDGVFEAQPSVWHHELLSALDAGVQVVGGGSMGALRAAELHGHGMIGVGRVFEWFKDGTLTDDAEVAVLHGDAEHDHRPLSLPLVNVRHLAEQARGQRVLKAREAQALVLAAERIFYQERTWRSVLATVGPGWAADTHRRWEGFAASGLEDLKALDAKATLLHAASLVEGRRPVVQPPFRPPPSSLVRRRRLHQGGSVIEGRPPVPGEQVLALLQAMPEAPALALDGLRRALLAAWARQSGLLASVEEVEAVEAEWLAAAGGADLSRLLAESGLDLAQARQLWEEVALERKLLDQAQRWVCDGPSPEEGLASEARLRGYWASAVRQLSTPKKPRPGPGNKG